MSDVAIRGGRVILEWAERDADVLIEGERIAAIVPRGEGSAREEIDASGLVVFPGAVDAHVHFNEPGRTDWEGWEAGSRGAAAGGVTTVVDMPLNSIPPTTTVAAFDAKREAAERSSIVDFALWGGLTAGADLAGLVARGAVGVKAFLCDSGVPEFPPVTVDDISRAGVLVAVHAEDPALLRSRAATWAESRPAEAEVRAVSALAKTGARVHVVHLSSADAVASLGRNMTAETCPHYLAFTADDAERAGALLKCAPPIRGSSDRDRLWQALVERRIAYVASDHSPSTAERKGGDIWSAWGGIAGVQTLLPLLLTEGARRRGLSLLRIAEMVASAPARLLGLARKGRIEAGADADLALVDPHREWTLDPADLWTRSGLSPWVGRRFTGAVVRTIVRGRTVHDRGAFPMSPGYGRLVRRGR